jgi:hypothetical protein
MTWMELLTQMKNWSDEITFIIWMKWEHLDENDEFDKTWLWMWMKPMKMAECYVTNEINDMDETRPCEWTRMKMLVNTSMELGPNMIQPHHMDWSWWHRWQKWIAKDHNNKVNNQNVHMVMSCNWVWTSVKSVYIDWNLNIQ